MDTTFDFAADLIRRSEGLRLAPYICPAGRLTQGYGHTGADVVRGINITREQAEAWLMADMITADKCIDRLTKGVDLNATQRAALVSFVFNLGCGAFEKSTLRRRILDGRMADAAAEFDKWVYAGGVVLPGLVKRRNEERKLFEG